LPTIDFASRNVDLQKQDQIAWCYASVISVLTNWLGNGAGWSTCEIASWALWQKKFGGADVGAELFDSGCNCCKKKKPHACTTADAVSTLTPVLNHLNVTYNKMKGPPYFDTIVTEIDADRPIILELKKEGAPGHVCMIIGYRYEQLRQGTRGHVVMYDPAANLLPDIKYTVDLRTMSFEIPWADLLGNYPTSKHVVSFYYKNLVLNGGVPGAEAWMRFHED
jgi:hypothetical protein